MGAALSLRAIFIPTDQPGITASLYISGIIAFSDDLGPSFDPPIH